jgi:hypothetical protein
VKRELVKITWRNPEDDWHWFWLLALKPGWVKLQGADDPDGCKHDGDIFWVSKDEIHRLEVIE